MDKASTAGIRRPWAARGVRWIGTALVAASIAACGGGGGGGSSSTGEVPLGTGSTPVTEPVPSTPVVQPAPAEPAQPAQPTDPAGGASGTTVGTVGGTTEGAGGSTGGTGTTGNTGGTGSTAPITLPAPTRADAVRFLTQATFGATQTDIDRVMAIGYSAWIDEQFARQPGSLRAAWESADAGLKAADASKSAGQREFLQSFYREAVTGDAQLRLRVAFALSHIFVVSLTHESVGANPRGVAGYVDLLAARGLGSYRQLLEGVALHPTMGVFLSHLRNQKEDTRTGRVPDENFAREVMQLFTIGLNQLQVDGTPRLDASGQPIPTYTHEDVEGLAKVFTGWSWAGPDTSADRFWGAKGVIDADRGWKPMQAYAQYHSPSEKRFLGTVVPAQTPAVPSLKAALDTLAGHANVGPFMGRQMIQRLVTSHPSPAYVARVASAFNASGGDMGAMVRAILLDPEARDASLARDPAFGKLKEPVLRLTSALRALKATSDSGLWLIGNTDDGASALGQSPLRAPSVFNFYRPGYVAPGTRSGAAGLTTPELQLTHETSVAGYANFMRTCLQQGFGIQGVDGTAARRDVQIDLTAEAAMADQPAEMVDLVAGKLLGAPPAAALRAELLTAVQSVALPSARADGSNAAQIDLARRNRALIAAFLLLVSPEFLVQK